MKGHNNPPPAETFALHIEELFSTVSGSTASPVTTDEQEAALDALLDDVRQARKDADQQRAAEKKPHDDAAKAVQAVWKPLLDRCDAAATEIKKALTPYRTAKQAAKDEAARLAREEAARKLQEAQDAIRRSDDLEERFAAEAMLKQASKLEKTANRIDRAPTGLRSYKIATVADYKAALLWIAKNDKPALDAFIEEYAQRVAPTRPMDGVDVTQEKRVA